MDLVQLPALPSCPPIFYSCYSFHSHSVSPILSGPVRCSLLQPLILLKLSLCFYRVGCYQPFVALVLLLNQWLQLLGILHKPPWLFHFYSDRLPPLLLTHHSTATLSSCPLGTSQVFGVLHVTLWPHAFMSSSKVLELMD